MERIMPGEVFAYLDSKGNKRYWVCVKCYVLDKDVDMLYAGITTEPNENGLRTKIYSKDNTPFYWVGSYIDFRDIGECYKQSFLISAEDLLSLIIVQKIFNYQKMVNDVVSSSKADTKFYKGFVYNVDGTDEYFIPVVYYCDTMNITTGYRYNPKTKSLHITTSNLDNKYIPYGYIKPSVFIYINQIYNDGLISINHPSYREEQLFGIIFVGELDSIITKL